jgi:uncharacterized membrane protein YfcA
MIFVLIIIIGIIAGTFGAVLGLGGGIIIIPILTQGFGVDIKTAVATSLVAVIATSTGGAITYLKEQKANIRLGMTLEVTTTIGALIAGIIIGIINEKALTALFIAILLYSGYNMFINTRPKPVSDITANDNDYKVENIPLGMVISLIAGTLSGLLGIGGGLIKVPVMNLLMKVPIKPAVATSNFMIGVTAATSALFYFGKEKVITDITAAITIGVLIGAFIGVRLSGKLKNHTIIYIFIAVILLTAVKMIWGII